MRIFADQTKTEFLPEQLHRKEKPRRIDND